MRGDEGASTPRRIRPVSQPELSGDQQITPMPSVRQTGSTSRSMLRTNNEYGGWLHEKCTCPRRSATCHASTRSDGGNVQHPIIAHLALVHEIRERAERVVDVGERVRAVHLVEVDVVGAQPAQRASHARDPRRDDARAG